MISLDVVQPDTWLVVASTRGFAKRVALKEFPTKGRHTGGVAVFTPDARTGPLAAARLASIDEDVMLIASSGLNVRVRAENIAKTSRSGKAKSFVTLKDSDALNRLTSLVGQAEGGAEKDAPPAKQGESKQSERVAASSNGHSSENGHSEKGKGKPAPERKEKSIVPVEPKEKSLKKKAVAHQAPLPKPKKEKPAAPVTKSQAREDEDSEQMELPTASFKPLPKKK